MLLDSLSFALQSSGTLSDHDLAIVGAGFAGLACARAAASRGLSTIVLDRKPEPGAKPHTTGLLVREVADDLRPPPAIVRRIDRIRLYAPNLSHVDLTSPGYYFLATDTGAMMRWLANQAREAGARLALHTEVRGIDRSSLRHKVWPCGVRANYVVGADGPRSRVARAAGLGVNRLFLVGLEAHFTGVRGVDPRCLHCFLDSHLAPGYIAWAVPGVHGVQIGLACRQPHRPDLRGLVDHLSTLFDFREAREVSRRGGLIPVGGPVRPLARDRVLLIGDAAGLVSPLTAGGIHTALSSGRLAGHAIADHLQEGQPEPGRFLEAQVPRFHSKRLLRSLFDLRPSNALYDAVLSSRTFRALAATLFFHHRGLFSPAAWKEVANVLFRAA